MSARRAGPMEGSAHASDADPTKGRRLLFRQLPSQGTAGEGALHQPLLRRRRADRARRSEEHTSELQSQSNLVCRLLLEKKKIIKHTTLLCGSSKIFSSHSLNTITSTLIGCRRVRPGRIVNVNIYPSVTLTPLQPSRSFV